MYFGLFRMLGRENIKNDRKCWEGALEVRFKVNVGVIYGVRNDIWGGSWVGLGWVIGGSFYIGFWEVFHPGIEGVNISIEHLNDISMILFHQQSNMSKEYQEKRNAPSFHKRGIPDRSQKHLGALVGN